KTDISELVGFDEPGAFSCRNALICWRLLEFRVITSLAVISLLPDFALEKPDYVRIVRVAERAPFHRGVSTLGIVLQDLQIGLRCHREIAAKQSAGAGQELPVR